MKIGDKLRRVKVSHKSTNMTIGKIYTYAGTDGRYIKLKEKKQLGYQWDLDNFEKIVKVP